MTLRLSAFLEEQIRTIISDYKTAVKSSDKLRRSQRFRKKMVQQQQNQPSLTARWQPSAQLFISTEQRIKLYSRCRSQGRSCAVVTDDIFLFCSQRRAAVKTQETVELPSVTKTTSAKVSLPDRSRRNRRSSTRSSSEDDSKAGSSSPGTTRAQPLAFQGFFSNECILWHLGFKTLSSRSNLVFLHLLLF